jgi:oligoendopeptidase F
MDPAECDNQWVKCWRRFMVGTDYSGYEDVEKTGWHRKLHIYQVPLYYIEYGLAQLGAVQVWAHSLNDPAKALKDYCFALSLGGTRSLPDLFSAAGANFSLDASTLQSAVDLMMSQIEVNQRAMS